MAQEAGDNPEAPQQLTRQGSKKYMSRKNKKGKNWDVARSKVESEMSVNLKQDSSVSFVLQGWDVIFKHVKRTPSHFGRGVVTAIQHGIREARWMAASLVTGSSARPSSSKYRESRTSAERGRASRTSNRFNFASRNSRHSARRSSRRSGRDSAGARRESVESIAEDEEAGGKETQIPKQHSGQQLNVGWRGSRHEGEHVDGVFEDREAMEARRKLRLLPEVQTLVEALWSTAVPKGEVPRMYLHQFLDYHLSIYHFLTELEAEEEEDEEDEEVERDLEVDLYDAWETAMRDWRSDTAQVVSTYRTEALHIDAFRDSVYELIDLHTDTLDGRQYIGYLKKLVDEITTVVDGDEAGKGKRVWVHTWAKPKDGPIAQALREVLRGSHEARDEGVAHVTSRFGAWLASQEAERAAERAADGDADGDTTNEEQEPPATELTPRGFAAAFDTLKADKALGSLLPPGGLDQKGMMDLFRLFDADFNGGISLKDIIAVTLDGAKSGWLDEGKQLRRLASEQRRGSPMAGGTAEAPKRTSFRPGIKSKIRLIASLGVSR